MFNRHQYSRSTGKPKYSCDRQLGPLRDIFILLWGLVLEWKAVLPGEVTSPTEVAGGRGRGSARWCSSMAQPLFSLTPNWMEQASAYYPSESFQFLQTPLRLLLAHALLWCFLSDGTMIARFFFHAPVPMMTAWEQNFKILGFCVQISEMQQFINVFLPSLTEKGLAKAGGNGGGGSAVRETFIFSSLLQTYV